MLPGVGNAGAPVLKLRAPVVFLVLAFTAVPSRILWPSISQDLFDALSFKVSASDVALNVVGYLPVGALLADIPAAAATGAGALLSLFAEAVQLFTNNRFPSPVDVMTNTLGTLVGVAIGRRWRLTEVALTRARCLLAAAAAACLLGATAAGTWISSGHDIVFGPGQATSAGSIATPQPLEPSRNGLVGHWTFDGLDDGVVRDDSGNELHGNLPPGASLVPGVLRSALLLDGRSQYVTLGNPNALRLRNSMSVTAWINGSSFPGDDRVILSNRGRGGFQLDVTPDQGVRTLKFLFTNESGHQVVRYGRTILHPQVWYHVAAVFDAERATLDVYVDGRADNSCLVGVPGSAQKPSDGDAYIGRRADQRGYEYTGAIDDLRVYSRALRASEIAWLNQEGADSGLPSASDAPRQAEIPCEIFARPLGWSSLASAGLYGVLLAVGFLGLMQRRSGYAVTMALAAAGGFIILLSAQTAVPRYDQWIVPILALSGCASVLLSVRRPSRAGGL